MVEAEDATIEGSQNEKTALAKIERGKIEALSSDINSSNIEDLSVENKIDVEKSLISATILLLREYGIRKSGAAVRDAVDILKVSKDVMMFYRYHKNREDF